MEETCENEIFVYTDGAHRYLVLPCRKSDTGGYRYRMLAANQIPGLLGCSLRFIDGDSCLYYEITSKQNLADLYENSVIPGAVLKKLLSEMTDTEKSLEEYLLNAEDLILNPHYIYRDSSADRWDFIYCPDEKLRNGGDSLKDLAEFLAVHADTDDREAAGISYRLCTLAENPNYVLGNDIFDEDAFFDGEKKAYGEKKENNDGGKGSVRPESLPGNTPGNSRGDILENFPGNIPGSNSGPERKEKGGKYPAKTIVSEEDYAAEDFFPEWSCDDETSDADSGPEMRRSAEIHSPDEEDGEKKDSPAYAFALFVLAAFVVWFGQVMRLRDAEKITDLALALTLTAAGIFILIKNLVYRHRRPK